MNPAFAAFPDMLLLSGFSGADVAVLSTHQRPFVRKAARTPAANPALQRQAQRQAWLSGLLTEGARTPEVIGDGLVDGCFYFDMTFVPGRDAATYLGACDFSAVAAFADRVESLLLHLSAQTAEPDRSAAPSREALLNKVAEIDQRTGGAFTHLTEPLGAVLSRLEPALFTGRPTAVHGDLTFENVLIDRGGQLWLIDAIDGPFTHYWLDLAKLFQECEGLWHLHRGRAIAVSVVSYLRSRWMAAAKVLDPGYPFVHYPLLALTFARILPYARTPDDTRFLEHRVRGFTERAGRVLTEYAG